MAIPNDPIMLMSYLNMKLRDEYDSLTELCKSLCVNQGEIEEKMEKVGYTYDPDRNQFQ